MTNQFIVPDELQNEWPDFVRLRDEILALYTSQTKRVLDSPNPTDGDMDAVVAWLNKNTETLLPASFRSRRVRVSVFSPSLSAKAYHLAQLHCPICTTKEGLFPISIFSIRIPPVSKQAISQQPKKLAAFERAIRYRFRSNKIPFESDKSICLLILFVVKRKGHQKDLDNMAKAIIDATKNVLFGDDRNIDHLNIIRITSPGEEYVYLNIRPTILNRHDDVLVPRMLHSWAGAEELNIADFL